MLIFTFQQLPIVCWKSWTTCYRSALLKPRSRTSH